MTTNSKTKSLPHNELKNNIQRIRAKKVSRQDRIHLLKDILVTCKHYFIYKFLHLEILLYFKFELNCSLRGLDNYKDQRLHKNPLQFIIQTLWPIDVKELVDIDLIKKFIRFFK